MDLQLINSKQINFVFDNGKFGFCDEDPFIVDGEGILEIHEMYLED
jgi:hypothetical protein